MLRIGVLKNQPLWLCMCYNLRESIVHYVIYS